MRVFVEGVGLLGPGLAGWAASIPVLKGNAPYVHAPTIIPIADSLPSAERRRVGIPVKLALAAGHEAFLHANRDASATATVFSSSGGDGDNVHQLCETLATTEREVSPTRFHNSVHNAAAGYWSIAARSRESSTSLCCHDASFAAGLLEAASEASVNRQAVALFAYDHPYPAPLHAMREIGANFGMALILTPEATDRTFAALEIEYVVRENVTTILTNNELELMRTNIPAARSLPLLSTLARGVKETVVIEYLAGSYLCVTVKPIQKLS